jgi:hypothetical protein
MCNEAWEDAKHPKQALFYVKYGQPSSIAQFLLQGLIILTLHKC